MYRERPAKSELQKSRREKTTEMTIKFLCCGKVKKMANRIAASEFYHSTGHCTHHKHQLLYSSQTPVIVLITNTGHCIYQNKLVTVSETTLVIVLRLTLVIVIMTNTGHCTHHTPLDHDPSKQKWTLAHLPIRDQQNHVTHWRTSVIV